MKKFLTNIFVFAIVSSVLLATLPVSAVAEQATVSLNKKQVHALEATAKTPAEHRTIAAYYRQQAQTFNEKSAEQTATAEAIAKAPTPSDAKTALGNRVYMLWPQEPSANRPIGQSIHL